ncbi:hypothetical protein P5673_015127 [Acropora cervicornis]|uniref:Uncharacterized protein n=1 Tax=Acropora cervicornis TaxID=6130 RepID=A0AAD9QI89_ACRCE|nr:hypothetical protein P5673_015127 [Acropora cervicornis]
MAKNLIDLGDCEEAHGMENPEEVLEPKELKVSQQKTSEHKRKITIHLKALSSEIGQFGSKFRLRRIIADLKQCLQEVSEETSQATSVSRKSKVSSKSDPVAIKARALAAQAFTRKQRESA